MNDDQDAFGHLLWDHLLGRATDPILEISDGRSRPAMPAAAFFAGPPDWPKGELEALDLARGRVLDLGCGAGRHALELQRRGFEVVAVDSSPLAREVCRARGVVDVRCMSIADVDASLGMFGTVLMLCGNLGLLGDRSSGAETLRRLASITTDDALLIAESVDPYWPEQSTGTPYSGRVRLRIRYGRHVTRWWDQLNMSRDEVEDIAGDTGWVVDRIIEGEGPDFVVVLEKGRSRG